MDTPTGPNCDADTAEKEEEKEETLNTNVMIDLALELENCQGQIERPAEGSLLPPPSSHHQGGDQDVDLHRCARLTSHVFEGRADTRATRTFRPSSCESRSSCRCRTGTCCKGPPWS